MPRACRTGPRDIHRCTFFMQSCRVKQGFWVHLTNCRTRAARVTFILLVGVAMQASRRWKR